MFLALLGLIDARIGGADVLKLIVWLSFCRVLATALTAEAWGGPRYSRLEGGLCVTDRGAHETDDTGTAGVIELRVDQISQLFDTLDPFPFRDRDLDEHAEEYIVGWARELPRHQAIKIVVHAPDCELKSEHANQLGAALSTYFGYRAEVIARDLKELFRIGRISLLIGLIVLATCVLTARSLTMVLGSGNVSRFVDEGLIILGWVANWKPPEIFLYDWWPLARRRDLYRRLSDATIELRAAEP